jgi:hypothetical protein
MSKKKRSSRRRRKAGKRSMRRRMRRNAGKKAAPKKAKKKASRKASKKKASRKASKKKASRKASKKASRKASKKASRKASKKAAPKRRKRRVSPKAALKRLSKASAGAARAMGMTKASRKNPGGILDFLKAEAKDAMEAAPMIAVQLGTMAAVGFIASKATEQIRKRAKADGAVSKYAGVISSASITLAAFAAMKMMKSDKARKFTLPVLFGGMAATAVNALAAIRVKKEATEISLGQHLGLPIGDYMALSGFIDVHGRPLAVDGMGDYVAQQLGSLSLHPSRFHEGTVISMGDYVPQALGELSLHSTIEGETLGEIGQMSEGRQGARALNSPGDIPVEDFIDSGSLSGSVFD